MRRKSAMVVLLVACLVLAAFAIFGYVPSESTGTSEADDSHAEVTEETFRRAEERACKLGRKTLVRLWRGHAGDRSPDVVVVPKEPNFFGSFSIPNHSGPAQHLQQVPLVLYGPGRINKRGLISDRHVNITDVYPTMEALADLTLPEREGEILGEALAKGAGGSPRLVVTIVWDGVGRNVLDRWPRAWPTLASLERLGTSYLDATVGSSPSITPATHASLGTGDYPRRHRVPAIYYREDDGKISGAFRGTDPSMLELTTFADEIDLALANRPKVGMIGWFNWHLPMMSKGKAIPGGDADQVALIHGPKDVRSNQDFYGFPRSIARFPGYEKHLRNTDIEDGRLDGEWMGHKLADQVANADKKYNPAWVRYQTDMILTMLREEGYGDDDGALDFFFTNYKAGDVIGHRFTMDSPEMREVLQAQDDGLEELIRYLDSEVKDFVVVLTSDHGHTPSPERTGAWAVSADELTMDINEFFGAPENRSLVVGSRTAGLFLDHQLLEEMSLTAADIAAFLQDYTIEENWREDELPEGYEERGEERILSAAFGVSSFPGIMRCAFGSARPPPGFDD